MLHVTNGQSTADLLLESDIPGQVVTWDDVLHTGAVPGGIGLAELRAMRARAIADNGWTDFASALQRFVDRDAALDAAISEDETVLWFEHDLYDQLQILQILDQTGYRENLRIICIDSFPGVEDFRGLGQLTAAEFATLFPKRQTLGHSQVVLAQRAWAAFRAPDPYRWAALLTEDTSGLPFLAGTVERWLQELPDVQTGLTRSQQQILDALVTAKTPVDLFEETQNREERPFMGDTSFFDTLKAMEDCSQPLISPFAGSDEPVYALHNPGQERWNGNWRNGTWWGGTCHGAPAYWAWDPASRKPINVDPATI